ncbi:MAG: hypothetical protein AB8G23_03180 [Myxococcota bacterium]
MSGTTRFFRSFMLVAFLLASVLGCEGQGDSGGDFRVEFPGSSDCAAAPGVFPSGLALVPNASGLALLVENTFAGLRTYSLNGDRPESLSFASLGLDSDGDGRDDVEAMEEIIGFPLNLETGNVSLASDSVALISSSNIEQVMIADPVVGQLTQVRVVVDAGIPPNRYPLLPAPGTTAMRTAISTLTCLFPDDEFDSGGRPLGSEDVCDPDDIGFLSNLTAGTAVAGGRLFVAMSNNRNGTRYYPGVVLVFDWAQSGDEITISPSVETPLLWTSGYNPSGVVRVETPGGREVVLVTNTGAIGSGAGASNVLTEAFVDVIDPNEPRIVARIPLGFAGPGLEAPAIDPSGGLAWLGATSLRQLYAVDLRALDDDALYAPLSGGTAMEDDPAVTLDGLDLVGSDARVFDADRPLVIPARTDRPAPPECQGLTSVAVNSAGTEAYATDFCDGTLTRVRYDLRLADSIPFDQSEFQIGVQTSPWAPSGALTDEKRNPSLIAVRPGRPGVDYEGPDVFVVIGLPDSNLCAVRVESEAPVE